MRTKKTFFFAVFLVLAFAFAIPAYALPGTASKPANSTAKITTYPNELSWQKIDGVCYNGSGVPIPGAITRGIDVSGWNSTINWDKVAADNVDFVFLRISYGIDKIDSKYDTFMKGALKAGLPVGTYVYSTATTKAQAMKEAQLAISKMQGYKISYPVVYDIEHAEMTSLTPSQIADLAITFCDEIKKAGYYPMIYLNPNWYINYVDMAKLQKYDLWLAQYNNKILRPSTSYGYTIWQSAEPDGGFIDGIPYWENVDLNFGFVDYTKIITPRTYALSSYTPSKIPNGWVTENGQKYYYINGVKATGRKKIGSKYYRFDGYDGHLFTSRILYSRINKFSVYVDETGAEVANKWVTYQNKRYYIGADHKALTGSQRVHGKNYFFDKTYGYMYTNKRIVTSKNGVYYYDSNGVRVTNKFKTITIDGKSYTYYFPSTGLAYVGWHTIKGKQYYFYPDKGIKRSTRAQNVTLTLSGYRCTFDANGVCTKKVPV